MGMEKKEAKDRERTEAVLKILKKQAPLTVKQEKFCNDACVERFLKAKGDSVKKTAKQLRAALSWRDSIGTDHLIADEFSAELAEGVAYVAGHDEEARPVLVFRIKQDYPKFHSQKSFVRLLVFTFEVAISSMSRFVDQFVILFDASLFRSASAFLNLFMGTLKLLAEFYPGRLHKAFVVDPPSLFSVLWKGVRPFVDLSAATAAVVSTLDLEDSFDQDRALASCPRTTSLRFEPAASAAGTGKVAGNRGGVGSTSSRFSFTVSRLDSLKPWYLSTGSGATAAASRAVVPTASPSLVGASPLSARSFSFASPAARSTPRVGAGGTGPHARPPQQQHCPRTPRPSFLQSPAASLFSFKRAGAQQQQQQQQQASKAERERESFLPYLRLHRRPYDEMVYRAKMRPPLGGLISIVAPPHVRQQRRNAGYQHHQRI